MDYRRCFVKGGSYFFTLTTHNRRPLLIENIDRLRASFRYSQGKRPFRIHAAVILPDHLHIIMGLPEADSDYPIRLSTIKRYFSLGLPTTNVRHSLKRKREKGIWQRRYWEHCIRDELDWKRHLDYVHYNPVKHNYVNRVEDWKYSSFRKAVKLGWYDLGWGFKEPLTIKDMDIE